MIKAKIDKSAKETVDKKKFKKILKFACILIFIILINLYENRSFLMQKSIFL